MLLPAALLAGSATSTAPVQAPAASATATLPDYTKSEPLGAAMEGWAYSYPVQMLQFEHEGRLLRMAYMDVQPARPTGQTVILFRGKTFGADYWANTLQVLSAQGYRVIAPDQIGFGKSSKPEMRYTFAQLADSTVRLLDHLQVIDKRIAGAGLDVFDAEPKVPEALFQLDSVVLLPHIANGTHDTRQAMADLEFDNLQHFFETGQARSGAY